MMNEQEYRKLSDALRAPYEKAKAAWQADYPSRQEWHTARIHREFDRWNQAQEKLFATYCRIGVWD